MSRNFPSLTDSREWNFVGRDSLIATVPDDGPIIPIPRQSWFIENSSVLMVGLRSLNSPSRWYTGGWAEQVLLINPGSTSTFMANSQATSQRLRLGILNLVIFPKLQQQYLLQVSFPRWLPSVEIEVWQYDGPDVEQVTSNQVVTSTVGASTASVLLLPPRPNRKGAIITNNSTADLFLTLDEVSSVDTYTARLTSGGYYETPFNYAGPISGVWAAAVATATVKEFL